MRHQNLKTKNNLLNNKTPQGKLLMKLLQVFPHQLLWLSPTFWWQFSVKTKARMRIRVYNWDPDPANNSDPDPQHRFLLCFVVFSVCRFYLHCVARNDNLVLLNSVPVHTRARNNVHNSTVHCSNIFSWNSIQKKLVSDFSGCSYIHVVWNSGM